MTGAVVLRGIDLAAFSVALATRLRAAGVAVPPDGAARLVEALRALPPTDRCRLYWTARLTLVARREDLDRFEAVFVSVFDDAVLPLDPVARSAGPSAAGGAGRATGHHPTDPTGGRRRRAAPPWVTREVLATTTVGNGGDTERSGVSLRLPSPLEALADQPFDRFREQDLRLLGRWLDRVAADWPTRRTRRREPHRHGRVDLRATLRRARATGYESVRCARYRPRVRRRRIVLLCDVSRSMRGYADAYLHLMRAAVARGTRDAEVFAFATRATRLTTVLAHHDAATAGARASARVVDRFGGTHIAGSLTAVLASPHGRALRGAVVIVASDGWDSDPPAALGRAVARIRRRAHRLVWLNPRAAAPGFEPTSAAMAAALPYCDHLLPAHTVPALGEALAIIAGEAVAPHRAAGPEV